MSAPLTPLLIPPVAPALPFKDDEREHDLPRTLALRDYRLDKTREEVQALFLDSPNVYPLDIHTRSETGWYDGERLYLVLDDEYFAFKRLDCTELQSGEEARLMIYGRLLPDEHGTRVELQVQAPRLRDALMHGGLGAEAAGWAAVSALAFLELMMGSGIIAAVTSFGISATGLLILRICLSWRVWQHARQEARQDLDTILHTLHPPLARREKTTISRY